MHTAQSLALNVNVKNVTANIVIRSNHVDLQSKSN